MKTLRLAGLLVLAAQAGWAAETAAFLDIGVGARAAGMGGAYTALADDANTVYWNPAGLARLEKREASVSHAELGRSTRHDFLAYAHPAPQGTFAGAFTYLSQGSIEGHDGLGRPTGSFNASDATVTGAELSALEAKAQRQALGRVKARAAGRRALARIAHTQ